MHFMFMQVVHDLETKWILGPYIMEEEHIMDEIAQWPEDWKQALKDPPSSNSSEGGKDSGEGLDKEDGAKQQGE